MTKVTYKKLEQLTGVPAKQFRMLADIVGAESVTELIDNCEDYIRGADTGIGLCYYNQTTAWLRANRKHIMQFFDYLEQNEALECGIRPPLQSILAMLNKGLEYGDHYLLSEVVRTLVGGYKEGSLNDPDPSGQISWWIYAVWFDSVAYELSNAAYLLEGGTIHV